MANQYDIGALGIMDNESMSWASGFTFFMPYPIVGGFMKAFIMGSSHVCGSSPMGKLAGWLLMAIVAIVVFILAYVPICLFFRFGTFWIASFVRIIKGIGGKDSVLFNVAIFLSLSAFFFLFHIKFIFPVFFPYIGWDSILIYVGIV